MHITPSISAIFTLIMNTLKSMILTTPVSAIGKCPYTVVDANNILSYAFSLISFIMWAA